MTSGFPSAVWLFSFDLMAKPIPTPATASNAMTAPIDRFRWLLTYPMIVTMRLLRDSVNSILVGPPKGGRA